MSDQNAIKIVVDTNLWISFLIGKQLASLQNSILNGNVCVYFSDELYQEIIKVLEYPKMEKYVSLGQFFELINLFGKKIHFIQPHGTSRTAGIPEIISFSISNFS